MRHIFPLPAWPLVTVAFAGSIAFATQPIADQDALNAQASFLESMRGVEIRYGADGAITRLIGHTGIVLKSGLASFKEGQPAAELLEKVGPALLAAGTEELRVRSISAEAAKASLDARQASPATTVRLDQYIRGRRVLRGWVNVSVNEKTGELTALIANFLPDRGLEHEPQLTADEVRERVERQLREGPFREKKVSFLATPAHLAYSFEHAREDGGALVWVFEVSLGMPEVVQVSANASTGEIIDVRSTIAWGKQ